MRDLTLFEKENGMNEIQEKKWYTIEEIASLSGYSIETLRNKPNDNPLAKLGFEINTETKSVGREHRKLYSENVLKALKEYQIKNSTPNALKNKQTAIEGNVSYIQQDTFQKTMTKMLQVLESIQPKQETQDEQTRLKKAEMYQAYSKKYESECNGLYSRVMDSYALKELSGEFLLPLPQTKPSFSATEVGNRLGISKNAVGKIAIKNNLKTSEYGYWSMDKKANGDGLVPNFRYYESAIPVIEKLI